MAHAIDVVEVCASKVVNCVVEVVVIKVVCNVEVCVEVLNGIVSGLTLGKRVRLEVLFTQFGAHDCGHAAITDELVQLSTLVKHESASGIEQL